jgi:hypothetical protein
MVTTLESPSLTLGGIKGKGGSICSKDVRIRIIASKSPSTAILLVLRMVYPPFDMLKMFFYSITPNGEKQFAFVFRQKISAPYANFLRCGAVYHCISRK